MSRFEEILKNILEGKGTEGLGAPESRNEAYLMAIAEMLANGGSSGGSVSWNDLTDKPFYETTEMVQMEVMPETGVDGGTDVFYNGAHSLLFTSGDFNYGEAVTVVFDGVEYPLNYSGFKANSDTEGLACYGNGYIISDSLPDTGEPFVFTDSIWGGTYSGPSIGDNIGLHVGYTSTEGRHTIRIYKYAEQTTVKPLEEKYLPETVATKEYADSVFRVVEFWLEEDGDGNKTVSISRGQDYAQEADLAILHLPKSVGDDYWDWRYAMLGKYMYWDTWYYVFKDEDGNTHTIKVDWDNNATYVPET